MHRHDGPPVMLLDLDGVVSPLRPEHPDRYSSVRIIGDMCYRPDVMDAIKTLHMSDRIEVRWLTTWGTLANDFGLAVGLPRFEVVPRRSEGLWWKANSALKVAKEKRGVVWVDDDLDYSVGEGHVPWLADRTDVLAICPSVRVGMTGYHVLEICEWLDEWSRKPLTQ